jgi:hypothetical protein
LLTAALATCGQNHQPHGADYENGSHPVETQPLLKSNGLGKAVT